MKHFYTRTLLLFLIAISSYCDTTNAQAIIAFLKETPKVKVNNCTSEDLMNILTEESLEWIKSIECQNINLNNEKSGIEINQELNSTTSSFIRIYFNRTKILQAKYMQIFANDCDNNSTPLWVSINENEAKSYELGFKSAAYIDNCQKIIDGIKGKYGSISVPYISITGLNELPLESLLIEIKPSSQRRRIQFYGIKIVHNNSFLDLSDTPVNVEDLTIEQSLKSYEYFDLTGRKLTGMPERGLYIRKCGDKTEKCFANGSNR